LEIKTARNWYWWLWLSPLLTIPTLLILYEQDIEYVVRHVVGWGRYTLPFVVILLLSALWHLNLLAPALNKTSVFIRWHGRQALMLAGIRTAVPICMVLLTGDEAGVLYAIPILILIWLIGTIWGQRQAARGDCSLMRWFGQAEALPCPEPVQDIDRDPDTLVDVIRFSRDPRDRQRAIAKLESLGMVEHLNQASNKVTIAETVDVTEDFRPVAKKKGSYVWLIVLGVVIAVILGLGQVSRSLRAQSAREQSAASELVQHGVYLAREGDIEGALASFSEAQDLHPDKYISAQSWNSLCWNGSLWGYAAEVMEACETAVTLLPRNGGIRDSRGVARAIMGDYTGAIEDFSFFVEWAERENWDVLIISRRQSWISDLRAGINPFNAEMVETLKDE